MQASTGTDHSVVQASVAEVEKGEVAEADLEEVLTPDEKDKVADIKRRIAK